MSAELSPNIQDYLKRIYELTRGGGKATTSELADILNISAASVTNMLQKLAKTSPPYVLYHKHQGAVLTEAGRQTALKILRRHRLIEIFLVERLGYTWDEVHEEAEILEHAMSARLEERIDAALNHPSFDPHGDPIPDTNLEMPAHMATTLSDLAVGARGQILRVPHEDPEVLLYLGKCGVRPGAGIVVLSRTPYDGTMQIRITETDEEVAIGPALSTMITTITQSTDR